MRALADAQRLRRFFHGLSLATHEETAHFIPELPGWRERCLFIARELFAAIEPQLYRYPAIDPAAFAGRLQRVLQHPPT